MDTKLIVKCGHLWDSLPELLRFLHLPVSCHWVSHIDVYMFSMRLALPSMTVTCFLANDREHGAPGLCGYLPISILGLQPVDSSCRPRTVLQPPPVVLWASWSQAASFYTLAHPWLRACAPISVTDLSPMCLQAEQLKI